MKCVKKQSDLAGRTKAEKAAKQVLQIGLLWSECGFLCNASKKSALLLVSPNRVVYVCNRHLIILQFLLGMVVLLTYTKGERGRQGEGGTRSSCQEDGSSRS